LVKKKPVVLVVDDSFTARTLQKSILEAAGYAVRVAVNGKAALDLLRSDRIDAVVSDIQMPEMDGFQLLSAMKNQATLSELPVVLVTSLSSKEDQERGLALGADAYIVKERFDHRELLETIRQLV
ncbi:MAG: response regulator, partial [Verrucomicrobium sp.]|nr:response regulator [Verrucomicrobium sp.]